MDNSDLVAVIPMLGRAHRVEPLLRSFEEHTPGARILFVLSTNDIEVRREVERVGREWISLAYQPVGDYAKKINAGYRHTTERLIFTGADDLRFCPGWLEAARVFDRPGVGVIGTNDLGNPRCIAGTHSTHTLITREYADDYGVIDQRGAIYCELYPHEYMDDELIETAKHRSAFAMAINSHVEHLHPNWGKGPMDATYAQQSMRMRRGRAIYQGRRRLWM